MIILDTSGMLAAIDASQRSHAAARRILESGQGPLLLSPFVLAELDYLIGQRLGVSAQAALLSEVERGAYRIEPFEAGDVGRAKVVLAGYRSLRIGLADASLVVLSERYSTFDLLSLDERHFRSVRGYGGNPFRLLPADAG